MARARATTTRALNGSSGRLVGGLLTFPFDADLLTEAVHSASSTIDSRHFANEFLRRRRLAEKGIVEASAPGAAGAAADAKAGGGWSEVAKKGGAPAAGAGAGAGAGGSASQAAGAAGAAGLETGNFKLVAAKKKGRR